MTRFRERERYTDETPLDDLRRVADIVGRSPTKEEYNEHGKATYGALRYRFGSLASAHEAAGLDPRESPKSGPPGGHTAKFGHLSWDDVDAGSGGGSP